MPNKSNISKRKKQIAQSVPVLRPGSIHYSYLLVFIIAFLSGIIFIIVIKNYLHLEIINFSTLDLLNFIFSVALSAAAIVLSITAINLSKSSEQSIIRQNSESKDLQNEIFSKTIEVLGRIESSTGINEKRIDDISKKIAELPGRTGSGKEGKIREIMRSNFLPASSPIGKEDKNSELQAEEDKKEEQFINRIMLGIANTEKIIAEKIGEGDFDGSGEGLVDGLFNLDKKRFSVSTFYIRESDGVFDLFDKDTFEDYFLSLSKEISRDVFSKSFLVFNKKIEEDENFMKLYKNTISFLKDEIQDRLIIVSGQPEEIIKKVIGSLS